MNIFKSKINTNAEALKNLQEQFSTLQEDFNTLNDSYATLQEDFKTVSEQSNTYKEEFERVVEENKTLKGTVEEVSEEIAEVVQDAVATEDLASMKAVEILAGIGYPQIEVLDEEAEEEQVSLSDKFKQLKGKNLIEFYNANKAEIKKLLKH